MMVFGGSATTGGPAAWGKFAWSPFCWRNDHENDQEHQQNIDQRNYLDTGNDSALTAQKDNSHGLPRS